MFFNAISKIQKIEISFQKLFWKSNIWAQTWVVVNAIPQFKEGEKELYQVFVTMHDITARIHSEELLRIEHEMSVKLSKVNQLYEGLEVWLDSSLNGSGTDAGGIYLINQDSGSLDLICHKGLSEDFIQKVSHWTADSDRYKLIENKKTFTQHMIILILP